MKLSKEEVTEAAQEYKNGKTLIPLAKTYGISAPTMSKYLRSVGVTIRNRGTRTGRRIDSGFDWLGYDVEIR